MDNRNYHITGIVYSYKDYQRKTWEITCTGPLTGITPEFLKHVRGMISDRYGDIELLAIMIETIEIIDVTDNDVDELSNTIKNDFTINNN